MLFMPTANRSAHVIMAEILRQLHDRISIKLPKPLMTLLPKLRKNLRRLWRGADEANFATTSNTIKRSTAEPNIKPPRICQGYDQVSTLSQHRHCWKNSDDSGSL